MQLATYKLYRSNALWFSKRTDGYSVTVRDGQTFNFRPGEMQARADEWTRNANEIMKQIEQTGGNVK